MHLAAGQDLAGYTQAFWHLSHNELPYNSFKNMVMWGDHAHFIIAVLTPLYFLWPSPHLLVVVQALAATTAGWALYRIAHEKTNHPLFSLAILYAYLAFVGLQFALDFDFHPSVLTGACLLWALYGAWYHRPVMYWTALSLGLITREDAPVIFALVGLYFILQRRWRTGLATTILAITYFLLTVYVLMPQWTPDNAALLYLESEDKRLSHLVAEIVLNPYTIAQNMVDTTEKRHTLHVINQAFAYLPLVSPFTYISSASILYSRFGSPEYYRWLIENHSNANIAPLLAIGAILGSVNITKLVRYIAPRLSVKVVYTTFSLLLILAVHATAWSRPDLPLKRWWTITFINRDHGWQNRYQALQEALPLMPPDGTVVASSGLLPYVAQRSQISTFPHIPTNTEWLLLSPAANPWPTTPQETTRMIEELLLDPMVTLIWQDREVWLFQRIPTS